MLPLDCSLPDTRTLLERLWDVLSDLHSADQEQRHMILFETYLRQTGDRIWLADVPLLSKVLVFFMGRAEVYGRYREIFRRVTQLLKQPAMMAKSSDEIEHRHALVGLYNTVGCFLLQTRNNELKPHLLEIIENIVEESRSKNDTPLAVRVKALELSFLTECLADFIAVVDAEFYLGAVKVAYSICSKSDLCCWALLQKDLIETILIRMASVKDEEQEDTLTVTDGLLWRLLSCTGHPEDWARVRTPSMAALRGHRYVLRREALLHRKSLCSVAAITLKMVHMFPDAEYIRSGLFEDIVFSATMTEAVFEEMLKMMPYFRSNSEYIKSKKLMLACLCVLPMASQSVDLLKQYRVAECLVAMLHGSSVHGVPVHWVPEDQIDLYKTALHAICVLYSHLTQRFINARLMVWLMDFLQIHYFKENNSPNDLALLTLKSCLSLCSYKEKRNATCDALRDANAVYVLLQLCEKILQPQCNLTILLQAILARALCLLSFLMENMADIQCKHAGVCLYIQSALYKRILNPMPNDSLMDNRLVVANCNFAWDVIVCNREIALKFISSGEIYPHIDILQRSTFSAQLVYLSMLVDLCEFEQSVPYLVSWRGPKGEKLLSVLCSVWRSEESRLGVLRSDNGCISDIERPLMGEEQYNLTKQKKSKLTAPYDLFGSARPKIYAVVQLLHRHQDVVDLCEEKYRIGHDLLPHEDQVTMRLVEAYLPLKMGEAWWEIRERQVLERVLPLDKYLVDTLSERYLDWALCVQRSQREVLEEHAGRLKKEEEDFYRRLREGRLTTALEALREMTAIARSADRRILLDTHKRTMDTIASSRAPGVTDFKVTYNKDMPVLVINSKVDLVIQNEALSADQK